MALSRRSLITKTGISTTQVFDMGGINISSGDFNLGSTIKLGNASGIITSTNFKTGSSNLHNVGVEVAGVNVLGADTPIGTGATIFNDGSVRFGHTGNNNTGIVTANKFIGDGSGLTGLPAGNLTGTVADARISSLTASKLTGALPAISGASLTNLPAQATIANNADNRVITGGSGVNLNGEADLTFDGTNLSIPEGLIHTGDTNTKIRFATDTIAFDTAGTQRLRIYDDGVVVFGDTSKSGTVGNGGLDIQGNSTNCIIEMGNPFPGFSGGTVPEFRMTATNSGHEVKFESIYGGDNTLKKQLAFAGGNTIFYKGTTNDEVARFSTDKFGIGTASPGVKLHVKGTGELLRLETTASGGGQCYIDFDDETATRASIGLRGSSSDTLTLAALNGSMRFDVQNKTQAVNIDTAGRLLVNTTSTSISSAELFEVKSTSTGFSHFRNNSSTYAPIYIDNEASNGGATLVPIITVTDGGGNRAGLLLNNNSQFDISGQGSVTFSTGGTVANATERMKVWSTGKVGINTDSTSVDAQVYIGADPGIPALYSAYGMRVMPNGNSDKRILHATGIYALTAGITANNNWHTVAIGRYHAGTCTMRVGDASSKRSIFFNYDLTAPNYGVAHLNIIANNGAWNTGGADVQLTSSGSSDYAIQVRHSSYYNSSNNSGVYMIFNVA